MKKYEEESRLIEVTYSGFAGTYYQPPEDAEVVIFCGKCRKETDAVIADLYPGENVLATCAARHEVYVYLEGGPDPDEEYEKARDDWDL